MLSSEEVWCDAVEFERALDTGRAADALALYRGDLLDGLYVDNAPEFEHWVESSAQHHDIRPALLGPASIIAPGFTRRALLVLSRNCLATVESQQDAPEDCSSKFRGCVRAETANAHPL